MPISAGPAIKLAEWFLRRCLLVKRRRGAQHAWSQERSIISERIVHDGAIEARPPSCRLSAVDVERVHPRLKVCVGAFHRALSDFEKQILPVARPLELVLERLIFCKLARLVLRACGGDISDVNFSFVQGFEALRHAISHVGDLRVIGRNGHTLHAVRRGHNGLRARSLTRFFVLVFVFVVFSFALLVLLGFLRAYCRLPGQRLRNADARNHISAFLFAVADHVFPLFLVLVFMLRGPRNARREVERFRIRTPCERVHILRSARNRECLSAACGNEV